MNQTNREDIDRNDRLAAYQRQIEQFEAKLRSIQGDLTSGREKIALLNHTIAKLGAQIRGLNEATAVANSTIAAMSSSPSWRLTSPLRKIKRFFSESIGASRAHLPASGKVHKQNRSEQPIPVNVPVGRDDFDEDFYLKLYPEVRDYFGGTPYDHYLAFGKSEGRLGSLTSLRQRGDFSRLDPQRDTVLVVSHEASATGAPVLSLNLIYELKKNYNVVSLVLAGGSIVADFDLAADIGIGPLDGREELVLEFQVGGLLAGGKFKFAIVNSAASRIILRELARYFIPSVVLIHEFAASLRPRTAMQDTIFWASEALFSAEIVRDNATAYFPELSARLPNVIPQGKCTHFPKSIQNGSREFEAGLIDLTFRPAGWSNDALVVLGIGSIQFRKGVDLFLACATRVSQDVHCRFVWIGVGHDLDIENSYSTFLEDQVKRAGLSDCFAFMNETSSIDLAYEKADVLLLTSRLDPLPNVGIDAMSQGLPFACFDKTTGFAELLRRNGLEKECVAPYLDVEGLASRTIEFLRKPDIRQSVGGRLRAIAEKTFGMSDYVTRLEVTALKWVDRSVQERADFTTVMANSLLDPGYLMGPFVKHIERSEAIRAFVRSWASGFSLRKPYPGFHPGIYLEQRGTGNLGPNPLAHYMRSGSPTGPWSYEVIRPSTDNKQGLNLSGISAALHLHVFYPDLAPTILQRLNANRVRPDLFISVPSESIRKEIECIASSYDGRAIEIQVVPNRGRDIGPLLTVFGKRLTSQYEFVGHLHTKKTTHFVDNAIGEVWFSFLVENLIGGQHFMADTILERMTADTSIGLVFPDDPNAIGWSANREYALTLATRMGLRKPLEMNFNFPVGTMFWARSAVLAPLLALNLDWEDYPQEPLPSDGSILHAIERLIPFVAESAGFRSVTTHVPGVVR